MKPRWQFSLGSLFLLMTIVAAIAAVLTQGPTWWLLAGLVIGDAILFCIIAGAGKIEEQDEPSKPSETAKEYTE